MSRAPAFGGLANIWAGRKIEPGARKPCAPAFCNAASGIAQHEQAVFFRAGRPRRRPCYRQHAAVRRIISEVEWFFSPERFLRSRLDRGRKRGGEKFR